MPSVCRRVRTEHGLIEIRNLRKVYGRAVAVDDISFEVRPGCVTGFLGPNGAGKSTTMRCILGLDSPTSGTATIDGKSYADSPAPLREVGALLDARGDKRRSARNHLRAVAATEGIGAGRVDEVLEEVGLTQAAGKPVGSFSLGMTQRLGIATALLADPEVVMLDEPVNGLDPDGVLWVRNLLRGLADEGRTVFLSSHLMSEMQLIADQLVVIGKGRIIADQPMQDLINQASDWYVQVAGPDLPGLRAALAAVPGVTVADADPGTLTVTGIAAADIGVLAHDRGLVLHELHTVRPSLEEVFMELTSDAVSFRSAALPSHPLEHE